MTRLTSANLKAIAKAESIVLAALAASIVNSAPGILRHEEAGELVSLPSRKTSPSGKPKCRHLLL